MAIGIPAFASLIAANRLTSATNELVAFPANGVRTEAIRRNARITVCPAAPTATACSGNWRDGWMVFLDQTPGNAPAPESAADILFRGGPLPAGIVAVANAPFPPTPPLPTARANNSTAPFSPAPCACSISTALTNDRRARDLVLIASGRIVLTTPTGVASTCPSP